MNPEIRNVQIVTYRRLPAWPASLATLLLVTIGSLVVFGAQPGAKAPSIAIYQLEGSWQIGVAGNTGCGLSSLLAVVTLNSSGTGTAAVTSQTAACGPSTNTPETFTITSLNPNGSGTANWSCGPGCGWNYAIQVAPNRQVFNLVDVTDPDQFLVGTAVRQ
jgi:hypothetical protein